MKSRLMETWVALTSDKRRASALGALVMIALLMWARAAFMSGDKGPAPAKASATAGEVAGASGNNGPSTTIRTDESPGASVAGAVELPPTPPLERDLFAYSREYFPESAQTDSTAQDDPKSAPAQDDNPADESESEEQEDEQSLLVRADAARWLRLRSLMLGKEPVAVIESTAPHDPRSTVIRVGESIAGFTLIGVAARTVTVERDGVQVELTLPTP